MLIFLNPGFGDSISESLGRLCFNQLLCQLWCCYRLAFPRSGLQTQVQFARQILGSCTIERRKERANLQSTPTKSPGQPHASCGAKWALQSHAELGHCTPLYSCSMQYVSPRDHTMAEALEAWVCAEQNSPPEPVLGSDARGRLCAHSTPSREGNDFMEGAWTVHYGVFP